jgi:hypothetical protein
VLRIPYTDVIFFNSTEIDIVNIMIEFIYTGHVKIQSERLVPFTTFAEMLEVKFEKELSNGNAVMDQALDAQLYYDLKQPKRDEENEKRMPKKRVTFAFDCRSVLKPRNVVKIKLRCYICEAFFTKQDMLDGHIRRAHMTLRRSTVSQIR